MNDIYTVAASPVGPLLLAGDGPRLTRLTFTDSEAGAHQQAVQAGLVRDDAAFSEPIRQLQQYFCGERQEFELELAPHGSDWEQTVWSALTQIPYGQTRSYGQIATAVCTIKAARAVGLANGRNPIAIMVPCHRVIGADGSLTGYGGGLGRKRRLLDLEAGRLALLQ